MTIQALEWRNRFVERWSSQGAALGTAMLRGILMQTWSSSVVCVRSGVGWSCLTRLPLPVKVITSILNPATDVSIKVTLETARNCSKGIRKDHMSFTQIIDEWVQEGKFYNIIFLANLENSQFSSTGMLNVDHSHLILSMRVALLPAYRLRSFKAFYPPGLDNPEDQPKIYCPVVSQCTNRKL